MRKITDIDTFRKNIQKRFEDILENETKSINLEKGIYNYAIKESNNNKIIKKWDNPYFVQLYLDRLKSIFVNLKNEKLLD